ncbi:hypothetical protein E2K59_19215 [Escherichia coli]|nr:hypothetical protein E2K59_19215 [Escherichia coli]
MSDNLPWKTWTPDDLAPPQAEFVPMVEPEETIIEEAEPSLEQQLMNGKPLKNYQYKDHGSLVSLSNFSTVGSLMGNLTRGSMMIEGRIARFVYISLYRMHQIALHGYFKTGLMMLVGSINRVIRPRLKLH